MKNASFSLLATLILSTLFVQNAQAQWSQNASAVWTTNTAQKVGIGTSSPVSKLEVVGQDGIRSRGFEPFITILDDNSNKSARIQAAHGDINFQKGVSNSYTVQMVIKENGNVGIGSNDPKSKLEVVGQNSICARGWEPFITILDDNSNKSARIQAAHGDIVFQKGVSNNYVAQMIIKENGNVTIGTPKTPTGYKLAVGGKIICEELKVQLQNAWPDYVFAAGYKLKPLEEVAQHIAEKGHLPNIPSACEVAENGISVGEMQTKMMEKIEELTLYLIEMKKENEALKQRVQTLETNSK